MSSNPLQQYFRQPKLFISLPSKGMFYKEGVLQGDYNNVPIFAMTGMDEIIMKTPDALFSGEATVKLIESCCPFIKDARQIPSLDIDALLVAIRSATYGNDMTVRHVCKHCTTENEYTVKLNVVLEHYNNKSYDSIINLDELVVNIKPLTYEEMSQVNIENFKIQKTLSQISLIAEEERQSYLDKLYQDLANVQLSLIISCIDSIQIKEVTVTEREFIKEWLENAPRDYYSAIKEKLEQNKNLWSIPEMPVKCEECGADDIIGIAMDQSSFFV